MDYSKIKEQYRRRRERVKVLFQRGMTAQAIAEKMKISRQRVYQILK